MGAFWYTPLVHKSLTRGFLLVGPSDVLLPLGRDFAAMSGVRIPHLQRRAGTYHLRVRVPDDVRLRVGVLEVRRSLRVHTLTKARPLALKYAARVMEAFEVIRTQRLEKDVATALVQEIFDDLVGEVDGGFIPRSSDGSREKFNQRCLSQKRSMHLLEQLESANFGESVEGLADACLRAAGLSLDQLDESSRLDVLSGVARAQAEQERLFRFRLDDRLALGQML